MTEEIINTCEYYKICESACGGTLEDTELCSCYQLYKQLKRLEQENKELKEENKTLNYQWHKQSEIGDEWYKVADKYKTALEEIRDMFLNQVAWVGQLTNFKEEIYNKINEVLQ